MLGKFIIGGIITAAIIGTTGQIVFPPRPVLFYNPSNSAAVGWYKLTSDEPPVLGSQVAAYAPEWARKMADERGYLPYDYPLIKTVWAVEGDVVCFHKSSVSVPKYPDIETQEQDVLGRDMPRRSGCSILQPGEFMLLSPDVQTGFDSRYFGPVGYENILGHVEYLGYSKNLKLPKKVGLVGFEG